MAHDTATTDSLLRTPLYDIHQRHKASFVPFAGYEMPVQYPLGIMNEHKHTRSAAGLFDVSHMGQVALRPRDGKLESAALALESLVPVDILRLAVGRQRYAFFTDAKGGILDDCMVTNLGDQLMIVINAACKAQDSAHLRAHLSDTCEIDVWNDRALLALQGPQAEAILAELSPEVADMRFMDVKTVTLLGAECVVSRSGYTGNDGYEISVPANRAAELAERLLQNPAVALIGLGARDCLRLEAAMCLYGSDIDTTTTPIEAGLEWAIQKARRTGGSRAGGFPGADVILQQQADGVTKIRAGFFPEQRVPVRHGAPIFADEQTKEPVGVITSGGFGPTLDRPIAMGYIPKDLAVLDRLLYAEVRGKRIPIRVTSMPFFTPIYKRT